MSLWYCKACKVLYGNVYVCPTCGGPTQFATITDPTRDDTSDPEPPTITRGSSKNGAGA